MVGTAGTWGAVSCPDSCSVLPQYMEIEDLVSTLESIVERFGEDIAPYAITLCQQLVFAFWRMQARLTAHPPTLDTCNPP